MNLLLGFLSGMFLVNSLPHLINGVRGKKHMTPLAKDSSALVNVVWAFVNIIFGVWLLRASGATINDALSLSSYSWSFMIGVLFMALSDAWLFGNPNARFPWFRK